MNVVVKSRHRSGLGMMSPVEWIISVPVIIVVKLSGTLYDAITETKQIEGTMTVRNTVTTHWSTSHVKASRTLRSESRHVSSVMPASQNPSANVVPAWQRTLSWLPARSPRILRCPLASIQPPIVAVNLKPQLRSGGAALQFNH